MRHIIIITIIILVFLVSYFLSISLEIKEQVTVTLPNGTKYVGEWKDGEQNGQGTYSFPNGDKYVGEWKKSSVHGKGSWLLNNGDRWVCEMRNDKDWDTTGYDKNGNIIGRVVNGVNQ